MTSLHETKAEFLTALNRYYPMLGEAYIFHFLAEQKHEIEGSFCLIAAYPNPSI